MTNKPHIPAKLDVSGATPLDSERSNEAELEKLRNEIDALRARVKEQAVEISRLDELAETDPLTGIANLRSFNKEIRRRFAEQQRDGRGFCLLFVDVDEFKRINDQFGHAAGDLLLQQIANVVVRNVRSSDIVYRIGGDEFSIIMPGSTQEQAEHAARRLVEQTVLMIQQQMGNVPVSLSIGLVESTGGRKVERLIEAADKAMYRAKKQGGNRFKTEQEN